MVEKITYRNIPIRFSHQGDGNAVVLLHGYLESLEIWDAFAAEIADNYRVVSIDLLGHGETGTMGGVSTMEKMAEAVLAVLEYLKINTCTMLGHSMGGYVTLAFADLYPQKLSAFCLFHSAPFADAPSKREARDRIIHLIQEGKKSQVAQAHIPKTFADENVSKFDELIIQLTAVAKATPDEGTIAVLEGMKQRPDRSETMKQTQLPFLYVLGMKDNFIPSSILDKLQMPEKGETLILEYSGHNGFIEEKEKSILTVKDFLKRSFS